MPADVSRSQLAVYGAIAVVLLLVGARAIRSEDGGAAAGSSGGFSSSSSSGPDSFHLSDGGGPDVVIDVAGAVRRPGVYRLPAGARVTDAVKRAGGETPGALLDAVNLAARLADGQQIVIPEEGPSGVGAPGTVPGADDGPISLGSATVEQLDTIDGIGPTTAADIVDFRDQHGGLSSVEQLNQISGIGPATMGALRDRLQP